MTRPATLLIALTLLAAPALRAADNKPPTEADITKRMGKLRDTASPAQRDADTAKIAADIATLPAGLPKLRLADGLSHLATEADPSPATLQAVITTLSTALAENPVPAKNDKPATPYMDIARITRYMGGTTTLSDPQLTQATSILIANDAEIEHADFTLTDLHNKKVTLSELRGKIVLVNFWATWCPPCRKEMPDLDAFYNHYKSQGLVVLSISDEQMFKVGSFIQQAGYTYPILLDPTRATFKKFHIEGIPQTFVFDRQGKLVAQSIDECSRRQLSAMLSKAGLKPQ